MLGLLALALASPVSARVTVSPQDRSTPYSPAEMRAAIAVDGPAYAPARLSLSGGGVATSSAARAGLSRARTAATNFAGAQPLVGEQDRPYSAHGRIFFRKANNNEALYSCSGTVVRSGLRNLIFTAGHCVYDLEAADFNQNITFVPAYRDGQAPLGQFPAVLRFATTGWISGSGTGYDVGAITVAEPLQDAVGGRPVDFEFEPRQGQRLAIFGYPARPSPQYDGEKPIVCYAGITTGFNTGRPPSIGATPCDMQQGSSGGGWINEAGYLVSVVSHGYCESEPSTCGIIFGPQLASSGERIYRRAGGSERPELKVVSGPRGRHRSSRAAFRFQYSASTPGRLECRLRGGGLKGRAASWRPCGKRRVYRRLKRGRYQLTVKLNDQVGRSARVKRSFRVVG